MRSWIARRMLRATSKRYGYDTSYLEMMLNNLEIIGQFMYPQDTFMRLIDLARAGLLDLRAIRARPFPLEGLPAAMEAAATSDALECIVVTPS